MNRLEEDLVFSGILARFREGVPTEKDIRDINSRFAVFERKWQEVSETHKVARV